MVECWVICLAAIHVTHQMDPVQSRGSDHCAWLTGSDVTGSHVTFSPTFPRIFPYFVSPYFFSCTFSPYFFPRIPPYFFSVLFSGSFSKVATFEIQRFIISVSSFSRTCRYNTVHVPCEISTKTSPVGLPLDGWDVRMRDLKGPKMNLFKAKEDWNVL
jgi:hypothetical protein